MSILQRIDRILARIEGWFTMGLLSLMVGLTVFQIVLRNLYVRAQAQWASDLMGYLDWTEPFVRLLVLWVTFLGASLLTRDNRHIKIDLASTLVPARFRPAVELLLSLASMAICGVMFFVSLQYLSMERTFGGTLFLSLPSWIGQIILPVGFGLLIFRFLTKALEQGLAMRKGSPS